MAKTKFQNKHLKKKHAEQVSHKIDKKLWIYLGVILLVTFLVYSPALKNQFTNWDDDLYVTKNNTITSISINELGKFSENFVGNFHPLTMVSLALDYHFFELDPFGYHLKNLLFHLLNTLLVFVFIHQLSGENKFVSLFTALLFAIHPMHVESVAWVAERKDVLYTFYFLLGLLLYQKYKKDIKIVYLLASAVAFLLSTLAKSAAVVFPVVLILIDYYESRKFTFKLIAEKIPFFAWSVYIGVLALHTQSQSNALGDFEFYSLFERFRFAAYGFINYSVKFLVPFNLSSFHPYPDKNALPPEYNLALLAALFLLVFMILKGRKIKWLVFGTLFYAVTVALVLQFITVGNAIIAERYTYVPYIGAGFIYATFITNLLEKKSNKNVTNVLYFFVGVQILYFMVQTNIQTKVWFDSISLWNNVIEKYPDESGAYSNLGHHYRTLNNYDMALKNYNIAIQKDNKNSKAFSNRGKVWFDRGEFQKALSDYNASIAIDNKDATTYANRGATYGMLNDLEKSMEDLSKALELDPTNSNALKNRSVIYYQLGDFEKNIADCKKYLELFPNDADMVNQIGLSYNRLQDFENALLYVNQAIQMNPNAGAYFANRSMVYNAMGNTQNALNDITKAQQLGYKTNPNYINLLKSKK